MTALDPVLDGPGSSDYERYIRTDELLALQKGPEEWAFRDELLFTVTHQASELWLKLATSEAQEAARLLAQDPPRVHVAVRYLDRIVRCLDLCRLNLDMLEEMSPWEYQQVRVALGHGSGFDSPGFIAIQRALPPLGKELQRLLAARGVTLEQMYRDFADYDDLHELAETLLTIDEALVNWRDRHFRMIERTIGVQTRGTQGYEIEELAKLRSNQLFPELWEVRRALTAAGDRELRGL